MSFIKNHVIVPLIKLIMAIIYVSLAALYYPQLSTPGLDIVRSILFVSIGFLMLVIRITINGYYGTTDDYKSTKHIFTYLLYYPVIIIFVGIAAYIITSRFIAGLNLSLEESIINATVAFFMGLRIDGDRFNLFKKS